MNRKSIIVVLMMMFLSACSVKTEDGIINLPEPKEKIIVNIDTLGQELPDSKKDGDLDVMLEIKVDRKKYKTYGAIKVQGSSTARWPKKNWTLKFYNDEARTERLKLQIGDSVAVKKWIVKAEWVDPSILRNGVSYRLWESMVLSREDEIMYEVDHVDGGIKHKGAQGFPPTFPAIVNVNKEHYGLSVFLMGHESENFNIDSSNPNHVYMEFDARGGEDKIKTWDKFNSEGIGQWIDGYHPNNDDFTEDMRMAIDELGKLMNGTQEYFNENFDKHLDKTNMIDMLLFMEATYDWDAVAQDLEMVTYDLNKWFLLPWDKDTTFGMNWDESGLRAGVEHSLLINYENEDVTQKPWYKTYHAFTADVEARYKDLRDKGVFTVENIEELSNVFENVFTKKLRAKEYERWKDDDRPSVDEVNQEQLIKWFESKLETLDQQFNYK